MLEENKLVQNASRWPTASDANDEGGLEWVELRPGVMVLRRKPSAIKMRAPLANKMRRKGVDK